MEKIKSLFDVEAIQDTPFVEGELSVPQNLNEQPQLIHPTTSNEVSLQQVNHQQNYNKLEQIQTLTQIYNAKEIYVNEIPTPFQQQYLRMEKIKIIMLGVICAAMTALVFIGLSANSKFSRIEELLENAVIVGKDVYSNKDMLEFKVELEKDPNEVTYNKLVADVFAQQTGVLQDGNVTIKADLLDSQTAQVIGLPLEINKVSPTTYQITGDPFKYELRPGAYKLHVELDGGKKSFVHEQDFEWGVLAINTNKSVYLPGDTAKIQIAVLNERGDMVCDAAVILEITNPQGNMVDLTSADGDIIVNDGCRKKQFIFEPDYETSYLIEQGLGRYEMKLKTSTENGDKEMTDYFEVVESIDFDVERITSTRIFPREKYPVIFAVKANVNYTGDVSEWVPRDFKIFDLSSTDTVRFISNADTVGEKFINSPSVQKMETLSEHDLYKSIKWNVNFEKGNTYYFGYWYDAPNKSPNFFSIGELQIAEFKELRQWQIAVDFVSELPHASVSLETDDVDAGSAIDTFEEVEDTTISDATLDSAGFSDTETVLILADINFDGNNANAVYSVRLSTTAGTAVPNTTIIKEPRTADDRNEIQRIVIRVTKTAGQGFRLEKAYNTAGSTAPRVQKFSMNIIGLDDLTHGEDYVYDDDTSTSDIPANGSPSTFATITTPASDPDWQTQILILDSFRADAVNGVGSDALIHGLRQDTGATVNNSRHESEDALDRYGGGSIYVFTQADTSAHTYDVRLQNSDASTDSFDHEFSSIIAFPSTIFEDFEYGLTAAEYNTANTAFNEIQAITPFAPQSAGEFLILGQALAEGGGGTVGEDMRIRVQVDGTNVPSGFDDTTEGMYHEDSNDDYLLNRASLETFGTSSVDIDLDAATDQVAADFHERVLVAVSMGLSFVNVSGNAYTDDNEASRLSSYSVCLAKNATQDSDHCNTTDGSGAFIISKVTAQNGDQLTLFVDHATVHGNVVTKATVATADITGVKLYQSHVVLQNEQSSALAIVDMDSYDNDQNATDLLFDAEDAATDTLSVEYGNELFVRSSESFTPGGNVDGHDIEIDGTWTSTGSETINIDGTFKLDTGGTLSPATSTLTFDGTGGTEDLITDGTGDLYNLTINDGGGSLTVEIEDALVVRNNLTIAGGLLDTKSGESNQIIVHGNWDNDDQFEAQAGTVLLDGSGASTYTIDADGPGTTEAFYNLTLNDSGGGATYQIATDLDVDNDITITGGTLNSNGFDIYVGGDWTNNDTFTEGTRTVYLDTGGDATLDTGCASAATCTNENFYNLVINKGNGGDVVTLSPDDLRVTNTLTITSGEFVQTTDSVQLEGATTSLQLYDYGRYTNNSTGDLTLGGAVVNDYGEITLNSNGASCGDTKDIVIASTAAAQRFWSGAGAFRIIDVSVSYQAGSATIKAASSTDGGNNGANWLFIDCGIFESEGVNIDGLNIN